MYLPFEVLNESKRKKEKEAIVFKECCLLKSDSALLLSVFFVIIFWPVSILVTMHYKILKSVFLNMKKGTKSSFVGTLLSSLSIMFGETFTPIMLTKFMPIKIISIFEETKYA